MAKKRIEFSLAEWEKQNRSVECLVFRDGRKPEDAHWFYRGSGQFNMVLIGSNLGIVTVKKDGKCQVDNAESQYDLFIEIDVPDEIVVRWMNLYGGFGSNFWYKSKAECDESAASSQARDGYIKLTKNLTTGEKTVEIVTL